MTLAEWVSKHDDPAAEVARLTAVSGLSAGTVRLAVRGVAVRTYSRAKALSEATGGAVSIESLCEPAPMAADPDPSPSADPSAAGRA